MNGNSGFKIAEFRDPDCHVRLAVCGELDLAVAARLDRRLSQLQRAGADIRLDLTSLTFIDCAGIAILITARNLAAQTGTAFSICPDLTRPVRRTLTLIAPRPLLAATGSA